MTDATVSVDTPDIPAFDAATAADAVIEIDTPIVPNHKASRDRKGSARERAQKLFSAAHGQQQEKPARTRTTKTRKSLPPKRKGQFVEPLETLYGGIAIMLMPIDPVCSMAIANAAPECAKSLDALAYQNDAVRRAVYALTQSSAAGAVLMAHLPILMAIAVHHVPAVKSIMGTLGGSVAGNMMETNMPEGGAQK